MISLIPQTGNSANKIGHFPGWVALYISVNGPATVWIAKEKGELEQPYAGFQNGIPFTQNSPTLAVLWRGPLYMIASQPGTPVDIQILDGSPFARD